MTKQEYFSTMPDQLLCECIKELTRQKAGTYSLSIVLECVEKTGNLYPELCRSSIRNDIFEEAAKRYLKIKMLQS